MATLCNAFLAAFGLSLFMAGQVSHGHKLFNVSLTEGERLECPNTNCSGKESCVNDAACPTSKCCIDAVKLVACCYQPGDPTHAPATTEPQNSALGQTFPLCTDYYPNPDCDPNGCPCTAAAPYCYENEICCAGENAADLDLFCYSTIPPTPKPPPGGICPSKTPPLKCNPDAPVGDCLIPGVGVDPPSSNCRSNEICCKFTRTGTPCCVVA